MSPEGTTNVRECLCFTPVPQKEQCIIATCVYIIIISFKPEDCQTSLAYFGEMQIFHELAF